MCNAIAKEYRDVDGYWIELQPGWRVMGDAHGIVESTKAAARARLKDVVRCDCNECKALATQNSVR